MKEWEALNKRRQLLWDKISKMNHEVEKIDQRLDFLANRGMSGQIVQNHIREMVVHETS
jgi:hypothetical protein